MAEIRPPERLDRPRWVRGAVLLTLLMSPLLFMLVALPPVCHAFGSSASAPPSTHQSLSPGEHAEFTTAHPSAEAPLDEHCIENCDFVFAGANALLPSGSPPDPVPVLAIASTFPLYMRPTLNVQSNNIPASLPPPSFHQRTSRLLN